MSYNLKSFVILITLSATVTGFAQDLDVAGNIKVGSSYDPSPEAGAIRWNGIDFEGYNGAFWVSLTNTGTPPVWDVEDNKYQTVRIGNQVWMAENLRTKRYNNGDLITLTQSNANWSSTSEGAYCWYDNDSDNEALYGKLYNWYATNDARGLCPSGWRVPEFSDMISLAVFAGVFTGGVFDPNIKLLGGKIKEIAYWFAPNQGATNSTGFSGLPAGYRNHAGTYLDMGNEGTWWLFDEDDVMDADTARLKTRFDEDVAEVSQQLRNYGMSVRCVRDLTN